MSEAIQVNAGLNLNIETALRDLDRLGKKKPTITGKVNYDTQGLKKLNPKLTVQLDEEKLDKQIKKINAGLKANVTQRVVYPSTSNSIISRAIYAVGGGLTKEIRGVIGAVRGLRPNAFQKILGAVGSVALAPFKLIGGIAQRAISSVFTGFLEEIGETLSKKFAVQSVLIGSEKIKSGIKAIRDWILGTEQVVETFVAELFSSLSIENATAEAFKRTNIKKQIDRLKAAQALATDPKALDSLLEADPELKNIYDNVQRIVSPETGSVAGSISKKKKAYEMFLGEIQPKELSEKIINPLIREFQPLLRFIQGMQAYNTNKKAQGFYESYKDDFPDLNGQDVLNVIGGAQFKGGEGGREIATALETIIPNMRIIPVQNPDTDNGEPELDKLIQEALSKVLPLFTDNEATVNTAVNAVRQLIYAINPVASSIAAAQALANTRLAQEQGQKAYTTSFSLGGADAFRYAQAAEYAGIDASTISMAFPLLNIAENTPKNYQSTLLEKDPLAFPYGIGLGFPSEQMNIIKDTKHSGMEAHAYKHLFDSIDFLNIFFTSLDRELPSLNKGEISKLVGAASNLYEMIAVTEQTKSVVRTGQLDKESPTRGFRGRQMNVEEIFARFSEYESILLSLRAISKNTPQLIDVFTKLDNYFKSVSTELIAFLSSKGITLPEDISQLTGHLKYNAEQRIVNDSLEAFRTGVPNEPTWIASDMNPQEVQKKIDILREFRISWFKSNQAEKFGTYQQKIVDIYEHLVSLLDEYVQSGGNLTEEQKKKFAPVGTKENISQELRSILDLTLDPLSLPTEEEKRGSQDQPDGKLRSESQRTLLKQLLGDSIPIAAKKTESQITPSLSEPQIDKDLSIFTDITKEVGRLSKTDIPSIGVKKIDGLAEEVAGKYSDTEKVISLSQKAIEGLLSNKSAAIEVIIHELRHAAQVNIGKSDLLRATNTEIADLSEKIEKSVQYAMENAETSLSEEQITALRSLEEDAYVFAKRVVAEAESINPQDISGSVSKIDPTKILYNTAGAVEAAKEKLSSELVEQLNALTKQELLYISKRLDLKVSARSTKSQIVEEIKSNADAALIKTFVPVFSQITDATRDLARQFRQADAQSLAGARRNITQKIKTATRSNDFGATVEVLNEINRYQQAINIAIAEETDEIIKNQLKGLLLGISKQLKPLKLKSFELNPAIQELRENVIEEVHQQVVKDIEKFAVVDPQDSNNTPDATSIVPPSSSIRSPIKRISPQAFKLGTKTPNSPLGARTSQRDGLAAGVTAVSPGGYRSNDPIAQRHGRIKRSIRADSKEYDFNQSITEISEGVGKFKLLGIAIGGAVVALATLSIGFDTLQEAYSKFQETMIKFDELDASITFVSGAAEKGRKNLAELTSYAKGLNTALIPTIEGFQQLAGATRGTALESMTLDMSKALTQADRAYNLADERLNNATLAIAQIAGKGVVQQEELRGQLSEALPGALQIAARALGTTTAEFYKLVEAGLTAEEFLPRFAQQLKRETAYAAEKGSQTIGSSLTGINNSLTLLFVEVGKVVEGPLTLLFTGIAKALDLVAVAVVPVLRGFKDLLLLTTGIYLFGKMTVGIELMVMALRRLDLSLTITALKRFLSTLLSFDFGRFIAGIKDAAANLANFTAEMIKSKGFAKVLSLGLLAIGASIAIGVGEALMKIHEMNKAFAEGRQEVQKFRDAVATALKEDLDKNKDEELTKRLTKDFRDSQSIFIKFTNGIYGRMQSAFTGGDVIDNLLALETQKFYDQLNNGNAIIEESIRLRKQASQGENINAKAVALAGDELAKYLSKVQDTEPKTKAERVAKQQLITAIEAEIIANKQLEDSLSNVDLSYGQIKRAAEARIKQIIKQETAAIDQLNKEELKGIAIKETVERKKLEITKKSVDDQLREQRAIYGALTGRSDKDTNQAIIDETKEVKETIIELEKTQKEQEISLEQSKQAERLAIIERAYQKALAISKESEQKRLIELQKLYNQAQISAEELEGEKARLTQKSTQEQIDAIDAQIDAVRIANISQLEKEEKLKQLRQERQDLILKYLEQEQSEEDRLYQIAVSRFEKQIEQAQKRKDLDNQSLDTREKLIDLEGKYRVESEKTTHLLEVQEKSLERQSELASKRNDLVKAQFGLSQIVADNEVTRYERALEIVRKINTEDYKSTEELQALREELSTLGFSGRLKESDILDAIAEKERKAQDIKLQALLVEQEYQRKALEFEIAKTEQAQKRATIEAKNAVFQAELEARKAPIERAKAINEADKNVVEAEKEYVLRKSELDRAKSDEERKVAKINFELAQKQYDLAIKEQELAQDTTSLTLAKEKLAIAKENLRDQQAIANNAQILSQYQRDSLLIQQQQERFTSEQERRNQLNQRRNQNVVAQAEIDNSRNPVLEKQRKQELASIEKTGREEKKAREEIDKELSDARKRFEEEDKKQAEAAAQRRRAIEVNGSKYLSTQGKVPNLNVNIPSPTINVPQPPDQGIGKQILGQLLTISQAITGIKPQVNATFNNQFTSGNEKELLRKARNQQLSDLESIFAKGVLI